jgi:hypothetical protein
VIANAPAARFIHVMHRRHFLPLLLLATLCATALAEVTTPAAGTPDRKAICDAVREHLLTKVLEKKPPFKIVFKVGTMRVDAGWAWFEGFPIQENGKEIPDGYLAPVDYIMVVRRTNAGWKVVEDQSRGDVPAREEVQQMMQRHPEMPLSIMPKFWRNILGR